MKKNPGFSYGMIAASTLLPLASSGLAAETSANTLSDGWQKPVWLADLSVGVKESYDDNVFVVSGDGLKTQSSWISMLSPRVGFNFAALLGDQKTLQMLSLSYVADTAFYHAAPSENYTANRINNVIQAQGGGFTFRLDNGFLYNDGSREAETYALNQTSNQNDKYDNFYSRAVPRERREQIQDRATTLLQYDWNKFFVRPTASLIYYGLDTYLLPNKVTPNLGYQNCPDRYDANGGADLGYKVTGTVAVTLGYRYGHQYQQQMTVAEGGTATAVSDYQRLLLGLEGKPWGWLKVKLAGGPDFRDYNAQAYVNDPRLNTYYGEAAVTATISEDQSVMFNYKQWQFVSANGLVPYFDSSYGLTYHWQATKQLGLDLGGKIQEADFTSGTDNAGSAPSSRDDRQYSISAGATYALNKHVSASLTYANDLGANELKNLPANLDPGYRAFEHQLIAVSLQYKF